VSVGVKQEIVGRIVEVGDGIAKASGLSQVKSQEMLNIETAHGVVSGIAFNLEEDLVGIIILGDSLNVKEGDLVKTTGQILSLRVSEKMIGRVVNPLGEPLMARARFLAMRKLQISAVHWTS
jgi:F-type H+-transporting ATPase subunit alpha